MRGSPLARIVLALSLLGAVAATFSPSDAYEAALLETRNVDGKVVADGSAYNAITVNACSVSRVTGGDCTITITNRGAALQAYTGVEDPNGGDVTQYKMGSGSFVSSGETSAASVAAGSSTTLTARIAACVSCFSTRDAYFTVEGEKADTLNSIQTRIKLTISYA